MKCLETQINHFIHAMICKSRQKKKKNVTHLAPVGKEVYKVQFKTQLRAYL